MISSSESDSCKSHHSSTFLQSSNMMMFSGEGTLVGGCSFMVQLGKRDLEENERMFIYGTTR